MPTRLDVLNAVVAAQPRTVVVLSHGGVLRLTPVADVAPAILDGALLGQAGGGAIADALFGIINPSGRLTETVPVRLEDAPAFLTSPGEHQHVVYGERIFVGYRGYDARRLDVTFPFGHGLSYTRFDYSDLRLTAAEHGLTATVTVTNSGPRTGCEVVQLYVGLPTSDVAREPRSLIGFCSVTIEPGESRDVDVRVQRQDLAYWDVRLNEWIVEDGDYEFGAGASSRDIRLAATIFIAGDTARPSLTLDSTLGEVLSAPVAGPMIVEWMGHRWTRPSGRHRSRERPGDRHGTHDDVHPVGSNRRILRRPSQSRSAARPPDRGEFTTVMTAARRRTDREITQPHVAQSVCLWTIRFA